MMTERRPIRTHATFKVSSAAKAATVVPSRSGGLSIGCHSVLPAGGVACLWRRPGRRSARNNTALMPRRPRTRRGQTEFRRHVARLNLSPAMQFEPRGVARQRRTLEGRRLETSLYDCGSSSSCRSSSSSSRLVVRYHVSPHASGSSSRHTALDQSTCTAVSSHVQHCSASLPRREITASSRC